MDRPSFSRPDEPFPRTLAFDRSLVECPTCEGGQKKCKTCAGQRQIEVVNGIPVLPLRPDVDLMQRDVREITGESLYMMEGLIERLRGEKARAEHHAREWRGHMNVAIGMRDAALSDVENFRLVLYVVLFLTAVGCGAWAAA